MARKIEIHNPTEAEQEVLEALAVGHIPSTRADGDSLTTKRNGRKLQSVKLNRDKAGKNVVRYNGEVEGKTFAFYCPRALLSSRPAKHITILVHETDS